MTENVISKALDALAVELVVCPRCEAKLTVECNTMSGEDAERTHSSRVHPLHLAYRMGLVDGAASQMEPLP